jgi:hypothetical protein
MIFPGNRHVPVSYEVVASFRSRRAASKLVHGAMHKINSPTSVSASWPEMGVVADLLADGGTIK